MDIRKLILSVALAVAAFPLAAQRVFTLDSCRSMALAGNKQLLAGEKEIEAAGYEHKAARANYLFKVNAVATYFRNSREQHLLSSSTRSRLDNLGTSASAMATTRTRTRFSLDGTDSKTPTRGYNPPDMLYGCYVPSYWGERKYEPDPMPISLRPLVYTYLIVAEFDNGIEYVKKARGELDGVATGVYLQSGTTSEEAGAILFDTDACRMTDYGIVAPVQSFGIPGYPYEDYASTKADGTFTLTLEVELLNGNTKKYDPVDVTAILEAHPRGGVIRVSGFEVTDEEGTAGGSGFEVDVDGWGDYEDIPLPIG